MIKRYLGVSLVAAGLVMAGCSSSDDDDPTANPGPADPTPITPSDTCTPCAADTVTLDLLQTATNDATLAMFVTKMGDAGLTGLSGTDLVTVFAPNDDAFTAADPAGEISNLSTEDLADLLNYHTVNGIVMRDQLVDGAELTMANGKTAAVTVAADGTVSVGGVAIANADDVYATNGVLYTLGTVLTVPADPDPVEPTPTDPPTDPGTGGAVATAVAASGNYSEFLDQYSSIGTPTLDDAALSWTVFAPSNTALGGATIDVQDYVYVSGALDAAALGALTEITTNAGNTFPVTNTGGVITVGGNTVEVIASGTSIVYSMDGTL